MVTLVGHWGKVALTPKPQHSVFPYVSLTPSNFPWISSRVFKKDCNAGPGCHHRKSGGWSYSISPGLCPEGWHCRVMVPNLFGTRDQFCGDNFSMSGAGNRWFRDDSNSLHSSSPPAVGTSTVLDLEVGDPCCTAHNRKWPSA